MNFKVEIVPLAESEGDRADRCWRSQKLITGIELEQTGKELA